MTPDEDVSGGRERGVVLPADYSFTVYSLYQAARHGLPNREVDAAKRFVTGLTAADNGEDGPELWGWMLEHLVEQLFDERRREREPRAGVTVAWLNDTFFLAEREGGRVIGTLSVVKDDRGRGAFYGIEGVWLAGFNILPDFQGRGLGEFLFYTVLDRVRLLTSNFETPVGVNLFTRNPTVRRMAERHGFTHNQALAPGGDDEGCAHYRREYSKSRAADAAGGAD